MGETNSSIIDGVADIVREPSEYMPMDETFSPVLHRVNQVIRWRAIHPNAEIPPPPPILTKYSNPPEEILQKAKLPLSKVVAAANVKKGLNRVISAFCLRLMLYSASQSVRPQAKG